MKYLKTFETLFVKQDKDKKEEILNWVDICIDIAKNEPDLVDFSRSRNHSYVSIIHYPNSKDRNYRNTITINADVINNHYYSTLRVEQIMNDTFNHKYYKLSFTQANKYINRIKRALK